MDVESNEHNAGSDPLSQHAINPQTKGIHTKTKENTAGNKNKI